MGLDLSILQSLLTTSNCYSATCNGDYCFVEGTTTGVNPDSYVLQDSDESVYLLKVNFDVLVGNTPTCDIFECFSGLNGYVKLNYVEDNKCKSIYAKVIGFRINGIQLEFRVDCLPAVFPSGVVWKSLCYSVTGPKKCELVEDIPIYG